RLSGSAGLSQNQRRTGGHSRHGPRLQQTKFAAVLQHLNLGGESLDPTEDRVERDRERFCVTAVPFQGMIASFDPFQCRIGADLATTRCSNARSANVSFVPLMKSIGTARLYRCWSRS